MAQTGDFRVLDALKRLLRPEEPGFQVELTAQERLLMLALVDRANGAGECWPSLTTLATGTGLARSTVAVTLDRLARRRPPLVRRQRRPRPRSTLYTITLPPIVSGSPGDGLVRETDYRGDGTEVVRELDEVVREPVRGSPGAGPEGGEGKGPIEVAHIDSRTISADGNGAFPSRESFFQAIEANDVEALDKLVGDHLYGFGPKAAEWVLLWPDQLLDALGGAGLEDVADVVGALGVEVEVIGDVLRDMCRKSKTGKWSKKAFGSFLRAAAEIRRGPT
jgi:hypothetical protein